MLSADRLNGISPWEPHFRSEVAGSVKVLILGAGGHAQVVADILRSQRLAGEPICFVGYLDDRVDELRGSLGADVLGPIADCVVIDHDALIIAVGRNAVR